MEEVLRRRESFEMVASTESMLVGCRRYGQYHGYSAHVVVGALLW